MRRRILKIGVVLVLSVAVVAGLWRLSGARRFQLFGELLYRGQTHEKRVALSFDDGPSPAATAVLLDVLADRGVKASFFLVGREMRADPELARRLVAAGHELANHSWSHQRMVLKSPAFLQRELDDTDALIRAAGHQGPIHFRPPYGKRLLLLPWLLQRQGRLTVMWDLEPESDPAIDGNTGAIVDHVRANVQPGSIILLHPMYRPASLAAVPRIIDALQADGWKFGTVAEMAKLRR